jgi:hypothetical protein
MKPKFLVSFSQFSAVAGSRRWFPAALVPEAQPEISQTRSVWFDHIETFVLKGQRISRRAFPRPFRTEKDYWKLPDTPCLANFLLSLCDN